MDLSVNGKHISSPTIVITEGDPSTVTQETKEGKFFITASTMAPPKDLSPKNPQNKKVISLQFVVGKITADEKETILSRPQIIALEGQKASITVEDKKETMSLSVTATAL